MRLVFRSGRSGHGDSVSNYVTKCKHMFVFFNEAIASPSRPVQLHYGPRGWGQVVRPDKMKEETQ